MNAYENNNLVKIKSRHFPQRFCKISNTKLLFSAEIQQQQNKKGTTSFQDLILYFDISQKL